MKFNAIHIIIYTILLALLPACELIHDDLPDTKAEGAPVYIRLTISTGGEMTATRANPTGGEEGDEPREPGETFENTVNDLYLFFYQVGEDVTDGVNAEASTPIVAYKYFTINNDYTQNGANISTDPVEIDGLSVGQTYHVLVVTNVGQELQLEGTNMTLGTLRDDEIKTVWSTSTDGTTTTYSDFVMTNESDASFTIGNNTSPTNPTTVTVEIERLAARVDYRVVDAGYEPTENKGDKVVIEGATLVNSYISPTYFLKRLEINNAISYLADEPVTNTYYVLDPKTKETKGKDDYHIYTPEIPMEPTDDAIAYWTGEHVAWMLPSEMVTSEEEGLEYGFLSYTHEHINKAVAPTWKGTDSKVVTGIVFKATYQHQGFTEGGTFYIYREKFYQTMEEIKEDYNDITLSEDATPAECYKFGISKYVDGICYYTYWIKHANDGDNTKVSPMEYAIVRNNIYQLNVTSVAGPGGVVPGNNLIEIVVAVQKWTKADDESVDLE